MLLKRTTDWPAWGWTSPFEKLERMRRQMDWLSGGLSRGPFRQPSAGVFPLMNVTEDKEYYYVRAELPGLKADELVISVTSDTLSISGERNLPVEDEKEQYHRREREAGKFNRIVSLPAQIEPGKAGARSTDGVLTITLPKSAAARERAKKIPVRTS